jgi:hypothetical protein
MNENALSMTRRVTGFKVAKAYLRTIAPVPRDVISDQVATFFSMAVVQESI